MAHVTDEQSDGAEKERQCRYNVNIDARSRYLCCSGKAVSNLHCEYVFVALGIQPAICTHHTAICGLPENAIFFHIISLTVKFSKKESF